MSNTNPPPASDGAAPDSPVDPAVEELIESVKRNAAQGEEPPQLRPVEVEEDAAAPDDEADGMTLEAALAALEVARQQAAEAEEKALRVRAEGDNLRKRAERDVERAHKYAIENFARELLPAIDALEMGLSAASADDSDGTNKAMREGTEMVLGMLVAACEKFGLVQVNPLGEAFDPEFHQAMATQEADAEAGTVLIVHQRGYLLNGRLVRPAMVVVSK